MSSSHSDRNRLTVLLWTRLSCIEWNVDSSSSFLEESSNQEALCVAAASVWPSEVRSLGPKGNGSIVSHLPTLIGQSKSVLTTEPPFFADTIQWHRTWKWNAASPPGSATWVPHQQKQIRIAFSSNTVQAPGHSYCNDTEPKHNGSIASHLCNLIGQSISVVTTESRPFLSTQFGAQFKDQATLIIWVQCLKSFQFCQLGAFYADAIGCTNFSDQGLLF